MKADFINVDYEKEMVLTSTGKMAYLESHGHIETRSGYVLENGKSVIGFVYIITDELESLTREYDMDIRLKKYNAAFRRVRERQEKRRKEIGPRI